MNRDQIFGLLRTAGVALMTYLVSSGVLTNEQASALINAATQATPVLIALGLAAYGMWKKRDAAKVVAADKVEGTTVIIDKTVAQPAVVKAGEAPGNTIKVVG